MRLTDTLSAAAAEAQTIATDDDAVDECIRITERMLAAGRARRRQAEARAAEAQVRMARWQADRIERDLADLMPQLPPTDRQAFMARIRARLEQAA